MRTETLTESVPVEVELSDDECAQLLDIGRRLAKRTDRYGQFDEDSDASLIAIDRTGPESAVIRVRDAVGLVALPSLQLLVKPKIPREHLLYLIERSNVIPVLDWQTGGLEEDEHLAELVARWFISSLERVIREGLSRDYRVVSGELDSVRGRLHLLPTARSFYGGRLTVTAEYDEFDFDTGLNRLLRRAALIVATGYPLPLALRQRAMRAIRQMGPVGEFRIEDMKSETDRMTAHYADAIPLAKQVILAAGRALSLGETTSWTFLMRTAVPVEAGVRAVLDSGLDIPVTKASITLEKSSMTVNPDLMFGQMMAVGDVKYKLDHVEWHRPDLYQAVAFAAAAGTRNALVVNFRSTSGEQLEPVKFGDITVTEVSWPSIGSIPPEVAAFELCQAVKGWLPEQVEGELQAVA